MKRTRRTQSSTVALIAAHVAAGSYPDGYLSDPYYMMGPVRLRALLGGVEPHHTTHYRRRVALAARLLRSDRYCALLASWSDGS